MIIHYWIREYSESAEFPEAHLYLTGTAARLTMITEAFECAANLGGWVTEEMDGAAIADRFNVSKGCTGLNVQQEGGAVDCFRMGAKVVQ